MLLERLLIFNLQRDRITIQYYFITLNSTSYPATEAPLTLQSHDPNQFIQTPGFVYRKPQVVTIINGQELLSGILSCWLNKEYMDYLGLIYAKFKENEYF